MFNGFTLPDNADGCTIALPANWPEVSRDIDNLAELKVVQLVLWATWGNGQVDGVVPLSIENFMEVTGLCRRSVANGIKKAIDHGYIDRLPYCKEDGNLCYYGIKLYEEAMQDLHADVDEPMQDFPGDANFTSAPEQDLPCENFAFTPEDASEADLIDDANFTLSNSLERYIYNNDDNVIRIQEADTPCKGLLNRSDNATLCNRVESLSKALGDHEHIASNVGQVRRILVRYQAQGGNFEEFLLLMYEARDLARRKTKMRRTNRMPYFFTCLKNASLQQVAQIA